MALFTVHPSASHYGWAFASPDDAPFVPPSGYGKISSGAAIPDPLHGFKMARDIYDMAVEPGTLKKYTVPILWDEKVRSRKKQLVISFVIAKYRWRNSVSGNSRFRS